MQAIARANRVNEGKNNGLIVDYYGILTKLRKALATFAGQPDGGHGGEGSGREPAKPEEAFLADRGASLDDIITKTGFDRNAAIESLNSVIRKAVKNRHVFPHDQAAMKVVYLAIQAASKKWSMPIRNWKAALNRL